MFRLDICSILNIIVPGYNHISLFYVLRCMYHVSKCSRSHRIDSSTEKNMNHMMRQKNLLVTLALTGWRVSWVRSKGHQTETKRHNTRERDKVWTTGWVVFMMMFSWWRHQMETFSALLAICAGNSPVTCEFPKQRPVTRSFDVFFHLRLNKQLSKQSWGWWFETLSRPLWRHCNVTWKHFQHRCLFVRRLHRSTVVSLTKATNPGLWCFICY